MDRRAFLGTALGAPAVYGLARAFEGPGRQVTGGGDETLKAAFADMERTRRGAVVIVVPADAKRRRLLGEACHDLSLGAPFYDFRDPPAKDWETFYKQWQSLTRQLFSATVLVCLDEKTAIRRFKSADGHLGGNRLLLDGNGAVVARQSIEPGTVAGAFVPELLDFVKGKELGNLRSLAAASRGSLDAHTRAELAVRFAAVDDPARPSTSVLRAAEVIRDHAGRIGAMLLLGRLEARTANGRKHLQDIIDAKARVPTSKTLPYGTVMPRFDSCGCGTFRELAEGEEPDRGGLRIACGMAMPRPGSRRFLRFAR